MKADASLSHTLSSGQPQDPSSVSAPPDRVAPWPGRGAPAAIRFLEKSKRPSSERHDNRKTGRSLWNVGPRGAPRRRCGGAADLQSKDAWPANWRETRKRSRAPAAEAACWHAVVKTSSPSRRRHTGAFQKWQCGGASPKRMKLRPLRTSDAHSAATRGAKAAAACKGSTKTHSAGSVGPQGPEAASSVSYTHLTLPTIYSV